MLSATPASQSSSAKGGRLDAIQLQCIRDDRVLFSELDFHIDAGEVLQIDGANGSGKTSLLRILCGLSFPTEGEVHWQHRSIHRHRTEYLTHIDYLGHLHGIKVELTPLENLRVAQSLSNSDPSYSRHAALEFVGLRGFEDVPCHTLSAGQRRRVALARLRLSQASFWVMDEPFTALDKHGIEIVQGLITEHAQRGGLTALTTHQAVALPGCTFKRLHLN